MSALPERGESRRAANARKRISRRPSRLGLVAGATLKPDRVREADAGFRDCSSGPGGAPNRPTTSGRSSRCCSPWTATSRRCAAARAQRRRGGRPGGPVRSELARSRPAAPATAAPATAAPGDAAPATAAPGDGTSGDAEETVFSGEIALATSGRIVLRVPSAAPLKADGLVGGVRGAVDPGHPRRLPGAAAPSRGPGRPDRRRLPRLARRAGGRRAWGTAGAGQGGGAAHRALCALPARQAVHELPRPQHPHRKDAVARPSRLRPQQPSGPAAGTVVRPRRAAGGVPHPADPLGRPRPGRGGQRHPAHRRPRRPHARAHPSRLQRRPGP